MAEDDSKEKNSATSILMMMTTLRNICDINKSRALELLEATNNNMEQAIELHFGTTSARNKTTKDSDNTVSYGDDDGHDDEDDDDDDDENDSDYNAKGEEEEEDRQSKVQKESMSGRQEKISEIQLVCHVDATRARQLLEAASGSMERAIDIHFSTSVSADDRMKTPARSVVTSPTVVIQKQIKPTHTRIATPNHKRKRQSTMDGFVGLHNPMTTPEKRQPRRTLDFYFAHSTTKSSFPGNATEDAISIDSDPDEKEYDDKKPNAKDATSSIGVQLESDVDTKHSESSFCIDKGGMENESTSPSCASKSSPSTPMPTTLETLKSGSTSSGEVDLPEKRLSYSLITNHFAEMIATTKRNEKLEHLTSIFKDVILFLGGVHMDRPRDKDALILTQTIDLILGELSVINETAKQNIVLNVSMKAVSTAIRTITGISAQRLKEEYGRLGDLGDIASEFFVENSVRSFFTSTERIGLSISQVHEFIQKVATVPTGEGSTASRQNLLLRMLRSCKDKNEIRFLVRTLLGNMRLGATLKSVITALAAAVSSIKNEVNVDVERALQNTFNICPCVLDISKALLEGGVSRASQVCKLVVGFPLQPMLANPAHSLEEVEKFMGTESAVAEWKYDGVRCQAHFDGKKVTLFSRNLIDNTEQYPDAVKFLLEAKKDTVQSFICDAEIVAVIPSADGHKLLPFQDLTTRRGTNSNAVSIRIYCYDLMHLNNESLLEEPLWKRQELLQNHFSVTPGFGFAASVDLPKYDEAMLQCALKAAVAGGAEGLMIKLTGKRHSQHDCDQFFGYESGTRSKLWLKLKKDYVKGSADTIDVVPIGAWFGNGRKAKAGFLSPVLLAVYDKDDDLFRSISRCMTFSDEMYTATRQFYFRGTPYPPNVSGSEEYPAVGTTDEGEEDVMDPDDQVSDQNSTTFDESRKNCFPSRPSTATYVTNESPPIWFKPLEVWEVSFADLTLSTVHTAAAGLVDDEQGRGVSMRFPRFIRRRPDKTVEMATTTAQIARLFASQSKIIGKARP